jgi:hypothetical protein
MDIHALFRSMRVTLALAALTTGCSGPAQVPKATSQASAGHIQNIRFGAKPGNVLVTICRAGKPEICTLTLADIDRRDATEYVAPSGGSIKDASIAGDRVLAVVLGPQADKQGNHPSTIVSFAPGTDAMTIRRRDKVAMRFPTEANGRLMFWRRDCRSAAERYCQHDLFEQTGPTIIAPVGAPHRFAEVDTIVPQLPEVIVNASYPADGVADGDRYLEYAGATSAWRLAPGQPFGLARLAADKEVIKAMAIPGGLLLLAQDDSGMALFREAGGKLERVAGLPPATRGMNALVVRDVAVSADGDHGAMIVGASDPTQPASLFTLDLATRTWRTLDPTALTVRRQIVLKE